MSESFTSAFFRASDFVIHPTVPRRMYECGLRVPCFCSVRTMPTFTLTDPTPMKVLELDRTWYALIVDLGYKGYECEFRWVICDQCQLLHIVYREGE